MNPKGRFYLVDLLDQLGLVGEKENTILERVANLFNLNVTIFSFFQSNSIIDRRFGEFDQSLSIEDKMLKRFAMEKQVFLFSFFS